MTWGGVPAPLVAQDPVVALSPPTLVGGGPMLRVLLPPVSAWELSLSRVISFSVLLPPPNSQLFVVLVWGWGMCLGWGDNATTYTDVGGTQLPKPGGDIPGDNVTLLPPWGWTQSPGRVLVLLPGGTWGHRDGDRPCHCLTSHCLYPQALQGAE